MEDGGRTELRLAARIVAGMAGTFLILRGLAPRGLARLPTVLAGVLVLRWALGPGSARGGARPRPRARRGPEVIEVKSPAELEPGIASARPDPTFANRVDRGREPPH
jgi:hypothetical protein